MNVCKICGNLMVGADSSPTCPACGLIAVLGESSENLYEEMLDESPVFLSPLLSSLPIRKGFFEKYRIDEFIGGGGQGQVWMVWDSELRRPLAMKGLNADLAAKEGACYRFIAEARFASQLNHPGILPIFDLGRDPEGKPYYVTELSSPLKLQQKWTKAKGKVWPNPALSEILDIAIRVCDIMGHVHGCNVVHRDLKPPNILVGEFGDVRIIDWGSAAFFAKGGIVDETSLRLNYDAIQADLVALMAADPDDATIFCGYPATLIYTAPELLDGSGQAGPETDIYSFGVMLYELLAGRLPHSNESGRLPEKTALRRMICSRPPPPITKFNSKQSRDLAAIAEKCMAFNKWHRYRTMQEVANEIKAALALLPVQARRPGSLLKTKRFLQRNAAQSVLAALVVLGFAISFFMVKGLIVEMQLRSMSDANAAWQRGRWREAMTNWDAAEAAGYRGKVELALNRAEAWTILTEPEKAAAILKPLAQRHDLGKEEGDVLLRWGEHELFDEASAGQGIKDVQRALTLGLKPADERFARGLLAETTPEALDYFHQAIKLDSFHHGAHRHSLGLEYLLGRHAEMQDSIRFFSAVYPDDPSAKFIEASDLAAQGHLAEAQASVATLRSSAGAKEWQSVYDGLPVLAEAARRFDPDNWMGAVPPLPSLGFLLQRRPKLESRFQSPVDYQRLPFLPSIQKGLLSGRAALGFLMLPHVGNADIVTAEIDQSCKHHPEALVPLVAGIYLESRQRTNGSSTAHIMQLEADLFETAARSPALVAGMRESARYLAARTQAKLMVLDPIHSAALRILCLTNIKLALAATETTCAEFAAYADLAMSLDEYGLAGAFLDRWERTQPLPPGATMRRVELDIAAGNLDVAWKLTDGILANNPRDAKALAARETIRLKCAAFNAIINNPPGSPHISLKADTR